MGLFSKKEEFCTVCNKSTFDKQKPKKDWNVKGILCLDCYMDKMRENFSKKKDEQCVVCGAEPEPINLWKPKKEWNLKGALCQTCFDEREKIDNELKKNCSMCGAKLGFTSYSPKKEWGIRGYICKKCWNLKTKTDG